MEQTSAAYQAAADRFASAAPGARRAVVDALMAMAVTDPEWQQPVMATFHGDVVFGADPPDQVVLHGTAT